MRATSTFLLCIALCGCAPQKQEQSISSPPRTRDRLAELRAFDPIPPDARPNPKPSPAMLGCYALTVRPQPPQAPPPRIRLTAEPAGAFNLHDMYAIEPPPGRWGPYTHDEIRLHAGGRNRASGWMFSLHATPAGFEGSALWISHTMRRFEGTAELRKVPCG